jgi:hypothetical protein
MEENRKIDNLPEGTEKRNPFTVPEGYFDSFPARLAERLQHEKPVDIPLRERIWETIRPQLALASAIAAFALVGYFGFRSFVETGDEWISDEVIEDYMNYHRNEFTDYYLLSLLEENDFYLEQETDHDIDLYTDDPDLYIEYLYQDDIELDLIYEEL